MEVEDRFLDSLTEEEAAALNEPEPKDDEQGPTPLDEKVDTKEPSPPEPEGKEEAKPRTNPHHSRKPNRPRNPRRNRRSTGF